MFVIAKQHYTEPLQFCLKNYGCLVDHIRYHANLDVVKQMIYILLEEYFLAKYCSKVF